MCKILIFGGTPEGRELADFCDKNKICAAKKCGAEILIIKRPAENGIDLHKAKKIIAAVNNE